MTCETPQFFLNRVGRRLFGVTHVPAQDRNPRKIGIVYCAPLFEEKLWSHRVAVNFARLIADRGIPALRFDYFGDGESEGLFEAASVSSRVDDIADASTFLQSQTQVRAIVLVGLGYGATLAIRTASVSGSIAGVVAWQPIVNGEQYMQDTLRAHLSAQMVVHGKVVQDREALVRQIEAGQTVNVEGYEIGKALYGEMVATDPMAILRNTTLPVLVQQISPTANIERQYNDLARLQRQNFQFQQIRETKFWLQQKRIFPDCETLFAQTLEWLDHQVKPL